MKKMLMLASVASMIDQFNMSNIEMLLQMGYKVEVACNFERGNACSIQKIQRMKERLSELGVKYYQIDFTRKVFDIKQDYKAYRQVKRLAEENQYVFLHCHSPIGGVIGRLVGHKRNIKVIYTAHGFHFFKGAPIKNWLFYYPIEWALSYWTDILITINKEDYKRAKKYFHANRIEYVPGVGVEIEKFELDGIDRSEKRKQLGVKDCEIMLLSVGELNQNKNHIAVVKTLAEIKKRKFDLYYKLHYFIVGAGDCYHVLRKSAEQLHVSEHIHLLGFCYDVPQLLNAADIYILPSKREGLNVSLMEAMASGLACICGDIRGNRDLIEQKRGGYRVPEKKYIQAIYNMAVSDKQREAFGAYNKKKIHLFEKSLISKQMRRIYYECGSCRMV